MVTLKEIVNDGDTASAMMFWLYLYHIKLKWSLEETTLVLEVTHKIHCEISSEDTPIGQVFSLAWNGKKAEVPRNYLINAAKDKYNVAITHYCEQHHGILSVPDRLVLADV